MSVKITQIYNCDFCGKEMNTLEQTVPRGSVPAVIHNADVMHLRVYSGSSYHVDHDICPDCWTSLLDWYDTKARNTKADSDGDDGA
jgi:hypothetical protein